jgi:polyhydroxybutyrate depolymerase
MHDGIVRSYALHVPSTHAQRPAAGAPLVFNLHGLNTTAAIQKYLSNMDGAADSRGFVVVTPQGVSQSWNAGFCCGTAQNNQVDDAGFVLAMVERLRNPLCIDARRVFAAGLSNGGHMAYRLACEHAEVFAAVSSVAGLVVVAPCSPSRAVSVLHFHGTADTIVRYATGIDGFTGAETVVNRWAATAACSEATEVVYQNGDVTCRSYQGCMDGVAVELCTIEDGGHQWPGGQSIPLLGHNTTDVSATERILAFFEAHPMP